VSKFYAKSDDHIFIKNGSSGEQSKPTAARTIRPYPIVSQDNALPGGLRCLSIDSQAPLSSNDLNQKEVSITGPPAVVRKERGLPRSPSTAN